MGKMTRRAIVKKAVPVVEEAEATLCEVVETVSVKRVRVLCTECNFFDEYRNGLCHNHYKLSQGFSFDEGKNLYIVKGRKR